MAEIRSILVAVDFAAGVEAELDLALLLARKLGARVTLLHASELPSGMVAIVPGATAAGDQADDHVAAERRLADLCGELRARGLLDVTARAVDGVPGPAILEEARAGAHDLVLVGTHGRTGLARLLHGSTAEYVLRRAPCPVIALHVPD